MSPLGTPGAKRGREELNNDNSETLMVEESPSPAPDGEQLRLLRDRMKRQRLCETTGDSLFTRGETLLAFNRENSSNRIDSDGDSDRVQSSLVNKRQRGMNENLDSQSSSSSNTLENDQISIISTLNNLRVIFTRTWSDKSVPLRTKSRSSRRRWDR